MSSPVVFLIYKRPDLTARSLAAIREVRPERLYVVADGPKTPDERVKTDAARDVVRNGVDWDCDVRWNRADTNMGLANRVSSGISWAFETCDEAIVLEDDCIAHPQFFNFCAILLEHYRAEQKMMVVSGNNFQGGAVRGDGDCYISVYPHCTGWATWKRAWEFYEHECRPMSSEEILRHHPSGAVSELGAALWEKRFLQAAEGVVDSWAYRWMQAIWWKEGLVALPQVNLVGHIGIGEDATNAANVLTSISEEVPDYGVDDFRFPTVIKPDVEADLFSERNHFKFGRRKKRRRTLWYRLCDRLDRIAKGSFRSAVL